ncbi:MAG: GntR family transcriptional regulator [SAR324 cluster bacterium]|uniref:GntR family transcriptional regulator n=1 Tax=SAR324 cluster bacterium TaxID=2024889 RepID=A0A2A4T6Y4_9DELT|nr:MAG: GntR family transcriptional regulator [SAR324 cluster bacterium]
MAKENLEEFAYRSIIRLILKNKFKPGDFLLEIELAETLKLSRTPVRHALGRLVGEGFLEKRKKKGCLISVPTSEDAKHVFFARENLEGLTATSAAMYATEDDIIELRTILEKEKKALVTYNKEDYSTTNEDFHLGIARMSRNIYLEKYCRNIFWRSNIYIFFFDNYYTQPTSIDEQYTPDQHIQIVDAIAEHDAEKAGELMRQHIHFTYAMLFTPWNVKKKAIRSTHSL